MNTPGPTTLYAAYGGELVELPEHVPARDLASRPGGCGASAAAEQLIRSNGHYRAYLISAGPTNKADV